MTSNINRNAYYEYFPTIAHRRNRFPFDKEINFNMKMGEITPIAIIRTVPGQTYNLDICTVIKTAPLQVPPMDIAIYKVFAFHNPDRNEWDDYPYWFGEKKNPEDPENENTYLFPKVTLPTSYKINEGESNEQTINGFPYNSFYDNIGCNPATGGYKIDATIPRSDRHIYNTYFRNQSLENPLEINRSDSDDDPFQNMYLRKICKPRDIITQCLPTVSGSPVEIPLGAEVPVIGNGMSLGLTNGTTNAGLHTSSTTNKTIFASDGSYGSPISATQSDGTGNQGTGVWGVTKDPTKSGLIASLSSATGAPIESLYQAIAYNTYNFLVSRGGNRYFEVLSNIYGVVNPDLVLREPEFLGSLSCPIDFQTVTQTSSTAGEGTPLAHRSANGYMEDFGNLVNKSFGEFGWIYIYGVVTYYPKYQQGVSKLMQTEDPLDLFNPIFNNIGDEPIYRSEIYAQADSVVNEDGEPVNDEVFGYGRRNCRLLYPMNEIHGEQRSTYAQSLDTNHFAEVYDSAPTLNKDFDKISDEGFKRCLQITDETQFVCNCVISGTNDIEVPANSMQTALPDIALQSHM